MLDTSIYTIGWVCAIHPELVAAQIHLDEEHDDDFEALPGDDNTYVLGTIGKHNVVIACLPAGEYGTSSAASVARDMIRTFTNVRIGLMVGIAGGAPTQEHDIRLGDVVVSTPGNGEGGVYQYDFGKQGQSFKVTAHLNSPATAIRTVVAALRARIAVHGHGIVEAVDEMLSSHPRLQKHFARPEADRLYAATYIHSDSFKDCAELCHEIVGRPSREDSIVIHYGLVASANRLMKDATIRDTLAKNPGVLCFEMEAAGLMHQLPFLVIRGICDYSDSHKSKEWQGYAAMTAASYAKMLLLRLAPSKVEAGKALSELTLVVQKASEEISQMHQEIKVQQQYGMEHRIQRWLSAPDPSTNYNDARKLCHAGTGAWFIHSECYKRWKAGTTQNLWLHGIPGCGKTILSSTVLQALQQSSSTHPLVLYFYFDFKDNNKRTLDKMLRSLTSQIFSKSEAARKHIEQLWSSCEDGRTEPQTEVMQQTLQLALEASGDVWILLDALDESESESRKELLHWLKMSANRQWHFFITSREEQDIQSSLRLWMAAEDIISIQTAPVDDDIRIVVQDKIKNDTDFDRWRELPEVCGMIETKLMERAKGMFRMAVCQIDTLRDCYNRKELLHTLESLPATLEKTYDQILLGIPEKHRSSAIRILQFLAYSKRPLLLEELVDVLAVEPEEKPTFSTQSRLPNPQELTRYCASLTRIVARHRGEHDLYYGSEGDLELDTEPVDDAADQPREAVVKMEVQLAHFSVKEYLISGQAVELFREHFEEVQASSCIVQVCLAYLYQQWLEKDAGNGNVQLPLSHFAARYWMDYGPAADKAVSGTLTWTIKLVTEEGFLNSWLEIYDPHPYRRGAERPEPTGLYYMALGGLTNAVEESLKQGLDIDAEGGSYGTALQAASINGHTRTVKLLLDRGADVNAQGGEYGNALQAASTAGHTDTVKLLLDRGADVKAAGGEHDNALHAATCRGHTDLVKLLLDSGADVNARGGYYSNALHAAVAANHVEVVELLLDRGIDVNAQGGEYGNALQAASRWGRTETVKLLLNGGAEVNAQGGYYGNALQAGCHWGFTETVELLLDRGANVSAGKPLYAASYTGHTEIVNLLLDRGADVNAGNALQAASHTGHTEIVKLLLDRGADISGRGEYGNALETASDKGYTETVKLLLDRGADASAGDALWNASFGGHTETMKLLLDRGANDNAGEALYAASAGGHTECVKLLLDRAADAGNALEAASDFPTAEPVLDVAEDTPRASK